VVDGLGLLVNHSFICVPCPEGADCSTYGKHATEVLPLPGFNAGDAALVKHIWALMLCCGGASGCDAILWCAVSVSR
jgi:hypothetical protein